MRSERVKAMKPKSRGAGIMVSDFIDEHNGFVSLTDEEYEHAKQVNPSAKNNMHINFLNMEKTRRVIGHVTNL